MTATVPGIIAWPLIVFMMLVVAVRYRWFNINSYDAYFNNTLAFLLLAQLFREHLIEQALSRRVLMTITTAQQMSFVAMIFAATEFIGFTTLWSGRAPAATHRHHRYYRVTAVILSAAYLIAATRARVAGQTLEVSGGWDGVLAWSFYLAMLFVLSAQLLHMCISLLRKPGQRREHLVAIGGLVLGIMIGSTTLQAFVLALTDQFDWTNTSAYRLQSSRPKFLLRSCWRLRDRCCPCRHEAAGLLWARSR